MYSNFRDLEEVEGTLYAIVTSWFFFDVEVYCTCYRYSTTSWKKSSDGNYAWGVDNLYEAYKANKKYKENK